MNQEAIQRTDDANIKPVSSLRSHFEGLKAAPNPKDESIRASPSTLRTVDPPPLAPPVRASFDLPRPISPWYHPDQRRAPSPQIPVPEKRRSVSPPKSTHLRPMSMFMGSSPQLTPSVNVESPNSPPRSYFGRGSSRSPERADNTPFGKVRELISQHSSRTSTRPPSPGSDMVEAVSAHPAPLKPPPVNRADKPRIPAVPVKPQALPSSLPAGHETLHPEHRRPSFEARISPFNTPPSSDDNQSPSHSPPHHGDAVKPLSPTSHAEVEQVITTTEDGRIDPKSDDVLSTGFQRAPTAPEKRDPRSLGFGNLQPRPPSRDTSVHPARANTVSERPSGRDFQDLGFSSAARPQQRHVSENVRSTPPPASAATQPLKISSTRDARAFGFGGLHAPKETVPVEPVPNLPIRQTIKAPPPRAPGDSKDTGPRTARQTSPVPDRTTKPGTPMQAPRPAPMQLAKAVPLPTDPKFPAPPKRYTDNVEAISAAPDYRRGADRAGYGTDSDDAEGPSEPISIQRTEYPDSTQTNRRAPYHQNGLRNIQVKADSRAYDVCGRYLCTAGFMTKVFDMSSGEQITGINHGENIKASAIAFKPGKDVTGEGKRIWIGNTAGDLQEVDIMTHSMIAENLSHNRREIVRILRRGRDLWTLDDDGKLFVWPADETGTPNLKYSHISHKVQKGHSFSLVADDKLWLATGKEVRVYHPGHESNFGPLTKPLMQSGAGEITSGTYSDEGGGRVYFGHTDGRVTVYSTKDYSCVGNVKASDYKINGLVMIGSTLWTAYKTGKIYVYDTTKAPWKVQKDWRAHGGPIIDLVLDPNSIWTLQRLQVTSIGHDGQAKFWDGMLEEDWIEQHMQERDTQYCSFREIKTAVVTWNCGASTPYDLRSDFVADVIHSDDPPEVLVFGFQEVVDLEDRAVTAKSIFGFGKKKDLDSTEHHQSRVYREWRDYLSKIISRYTSVHNSYSELHTSSLVGLFQCIFIRQEERVNVRNLHAINVKCGMKGHYGNKGALVTRFVLGDSSLCFVNCHLAAGQTHTAHRNSDVTTILESENLPMEQDRDTRMSLYVGGGDGTQILDHEICILNGDLNYRIDTVPRDTVIKMVKANDLNKLLERDQIMVSRKRVQGFRLNSFVELPITFAPTYKYDVGTDNYDSSEKKRSPAWCDRVLYRGSGRVKQLEYRRHEVRVSDHRPVSGLFRIRIKIIDPKKRANVKKECEDMFNAITKKTMEQMAQTHLIREYGMSREEVIRKLGA